MVAVAALGLIAGCGFSPYDMPLPGGADTGDKPYTVTAEFRDVLDLVPQSGVRVNDLPVGKVTDVQLNGWTAKVTLEINEEVELPANTTATLRQTSLLGEKFVSLDAPADGGRGRLENGANLSLAQTGRNPEFEEVFSAASLLLNGGGLERTNTIIKELNATLDGNGPQIKELLSTSQEFIGQLDNNKQQLLTSVEKVNRLAIATNQQRGAIEGALDTLPGALRTVDAQRGDLVRLLKAMDRLSLVATKVIRRTKADTVANLTSLTPTLRNLATASDDLAYSLRSVLTYPFTDGTVGGTAARASANCNADGGVGGGKDWCVGDYANLSIRAQLDYRDVTNLLGIELADFRAASIPASAPGTSPEATDAVDQLAKELAESPVLGGLSGRTARPAPEPEPQPAQTPDSSGTSPVCSVLGLCRPAAATSFDENGAGDLTDLLVTAARGSR